MKKKFDKIQKQVGIMLDIADSETLQRKFGLATDKEITTALMEDELEDCATWINELRFGIVATPMSNVITEFPSPVSWTVLSRFVSTVAARPGV
jgi:hypothetical protein